MAGLAPVDVALLPVWGWGPRVGAGHMDPERAAEAVRLLAPRVAIPIHWGTYLADTVLHDRGSRLVDPPQVFAASVADRAPDVKVEILEPGATLRLQ
jgi:L-ascorbate metabolism protein UlaG (beta-lactamase superfamily)